MLINTEPIEELISLSLRTPFIKNAKVVSLFLIADAESGKTEILKKFSNIKGVEYVTDITYAGLIDLLDDIENKKIKFFVIPDFLKLTMRKSSTASNTLSLLNAIIEEGVAKINTFFRKKDYNNLTCGLISGITKKELLDKRHKWASIGFLSRILPISFSYSPATQLKIMDEINKMEFKIEMEKNFKRTPTNIYISKEMAERIQTLTLSIKEAEEIYGFRRQKQLLSLVLANAQKNDRIEVTQEDVDTIARLSNYINLDFNTL